MKSARYGKKNCWNAAILVTSSVNETIPAQTKAGFVQEE
ncbi:UNVERIFIED_ORG: hypothetical protein ABRZ91_001353 [Heyndrickxia coagulans]